MRKSRDGGKKHVEKKENYETYNITNSNISFKDLGLSLLISCCLWLSPAVSVYLRLFWAILGLFLNVRWLSLDIPLIFPGLYRDYSWISPVLDLEYPWIFLGFTLDIHGLHLDYPWILPAFARLSLHNPWIFSGLSLKYPWNFTGLSQDLPWIPLIYPQIIPW